MWYCELGTNIVRHLCDAFSNEVRTTLNTIPQNLKPLLPFLKPTIGGQPSRRNKGGEIVVFEEECEWRYTPLDLMPTWKMGYGRDYLNSMLDHDLSLSRRIEVHSGIVDEVFVESEAEKNYLEGLFPSHIGRINNWGPHNPTPCD
jgi:hypothetical protein